MPVHPALDVRVDFVPDEEDYDRTDRNHSWAREGCRGDRGLLRREQSQPVHRALDGPASDRQENPEDTRRVRSTDQLGRSDDFARDSVHERHRGELLLFSAKRGRPCDRSMALRPREPDWRDRSGLPVALAAPSLSARAAHLGAMPRFDARANVSKKPHVRSLAVMMPSTLSRRVTTIHRVFLPSITRAAARNVVNGLTVATGDVMMPRTKTFDGFFPFEVTCHRMSRSVIRPIGRPCSTTTSPPIFFIAIRFAASSTVRSGSTTITSRVITSRTKTNPCPVPDIAAAHQDFRARSGRRLRGERSNSP